MRFGTMVASAGLVLAALTACGSADAAADFRDLPGVRDATVHKRALDTDYYGYTAVIDMEPDATPAQIVTALDRLNEWRKGPGNGGDDSVRLYVGGGTVSDEESGWGDGANHGGPAAVIATARSHARNVAAVDLLRRATEVLHAPVTVRSYEWAVTTDDPRTMLRAVAADRALAAAPGLHLVQPYEGTGPAPWSRQPEFASAEPLTAAHLRAYDAAVRNARMVRDGRAHVDFVGSDTGVTPNPVHRFPGSITIRMTLRLPGMVGPQALAADPVTDPRWPAVAAQLDLLRTLPTGSSLSVDLEWGRAPEGGAGHYRWLVELSNGRKVPRSPLWNAAAASYLAR